MSYDNSKKKINIFRYDSSGQFVWFVGISSEGSVLSITTSAPALQGNVYGLNGKLL